MPGTGRYAFSLQRVIIYTRKADHSQENCRRERLKMWFLEVDGRYKKIGAITSTEPLILPPAVIREIFNEVIRTDALERAKQFNISISYETWEGSFS